MSILFIVLSFVGRYWKQLLVVLVPIVLTAGGYLYGYHHAMQKVKLREAANLVDRINKGIEVEKQFKDKKIKYRKDRDLTPVNDKRDSCILSNLPEDLDKCLNSIK